MVIIWLMMVNNNLVGGWAYPAEKYEFVNWDDEIPNIWKNKIHVPNHKSIGFENPLSTKKMWIWFTSDKNICKSLVV